MPDIDLATGLPVLREGERWRVGPTRGIEYPGGYSNAGPTYYSTYEVAVERLVPGTEVQREVRVRGPKYRYSWWGSPREQIQSAVYETVTEQVPEKWALVMSSTLARGEQLTREIILARAVALIKKRDLQEETESLIGVYPPKSLA